MGDFREAVSGNGVVLGDKDTRLILEALLPGRPDPWGEAERATREIIKRVQPTFVSDERRRGVIGYVQRILKECLGCEVFPFGSVPLKTYLPDGDIDLTAFDGFTIDEPFANHVYAVLEAEDRNRSAEFVVKDVQYIRAEVKLVKCLVQNIVVDISFNQLGGLCTLCFLEEVDRLIGKDHLFKRSIILIKAWCYYESRILGAHHGLISTYALETLVLYIFHLFHSSLNGPLAVLYKFLDYFSNFDWENFCVSLTGPVHVSSLPEIVAERPENGGSDLLLSDDFLRECIKKFSVPSRGTDTNSRTFIHKHLNIVDPLKENNNLGRSVSKGNFFRIRSAFAFGARKLGRILLEPEENIVEEVRRFFTNTLHRHGTGPRPDVLEIESSNSCNGYGESRAGFGGTDLETLGPGKQKGLKKSVCSTFSSVSDTLKDETSTCSDRLSGDAEDLATSGIELLRMSSDNDARLSLSSQECKSKPFVPHAPHLYFSHSLVNGQTGNEFDCSSTDNNTRERQTETARNHESLTPLQDLSGDFEGHLINLQSGRWWYDHVLSTTVPSANLPVSQPSLFQRKSPSCPWDASRQSVHFGGPAFFPMSPPVVPGVAFPVDELPKTRGTGMYFPITNHDSYRERTSPVKGRTQAPLRSPRSEVQSSIRQGGWKQSSPRGKFYEDANGFAHVSEREVHFGSVGPVTLEDSSLDSTTQPDSSPRRDPRFSMSDDRHAVQSYRLKDEDFPPL